MRFLISSDSESDSEDEIGGVDEEAIVATPVAIVSETHNDDAVSTAAVDSTVVTSISDDTPQSEQMLSEQLPTSSPSASKESNGSSMNSEASLVYGLDKTELIHWIRSTKNNALVKYLHDIERNEIDGKHFLCLTQCSMKYLGVSSEDTPAVLKFIENIIDGCMEIDES